MIFGGDQDALLPPSGTTARGGYDPDAILPPTTVPSRKPKKRRKWYHIFRFKESDLNGPGDAPPGYYYPPPGGYGPPQQGYYPQRGPGGLPTDRATVDTKVYIPAQYEHLSIHPGTGMAVVIGGVLLVLLLQKNRASAK